MPRSTEEPPARSRQSNSVFLVESTIKRCSQIATLPAVAVQIIHLSEDPDSSIEAMNKVVLNDPILGARILKLVNSAYYGMPGQVDSIQRAIVMLGFKAVKNIAIAASLVNMVRGGRITEGFCATDLWNHSIAVATSAQMLARHSTHVSIDEAFLAGLIHDVGIVVEMQAFGPIFAQMIQKLYADQALTFREAEKEAFGASHEDFGAGLARNWNFPESLQLVTGYHHRPLELAETDRQLPGLVHVADVLASRIGVGYTRTVETASVDPRFLSELGLTDADLDAVAEQLPEAVRSSQALFSDRGQSQSKSAISD
jgi:HD-like signal output (HDOD) protein